MTDYSVYRFSKKEWVYETLRAIAILCFTGLLFFESPLGICLILPAGIFLIKDRNGKKREERLMELRSDFKEFVGSFSSSVQAGYTIEQSIQIGMEDLQRLYPQDKRAFVGELAWMTQQLKLQIPGDRLFEDLAKRSGIEEIRSFSVVLGIGRKQGGNLVQITRRTADHINRKIQVRMEMEQTVAGKEMEKNIMFAMPYFMLLYLRVTNPGYMDVLFSNVLGQGIMMVCLVLLWIAGKWSDHIVKIQI